MTLNPFANSGFNSGDTGKIAFGSIPAKDVKDFHDNSDVDAGALSQHHTLGEGIGQAAAGNHKHDVLPRQQVLLVANQSFPAGAVTKVINWIFITFPGRTNWGYGNGGFTIPEDGWYVIDFRALFTPLATDFKIDTSIRVNNVDVTTVEKINAASNWETIKINDELNLKKGDIIEIFIYSSHAAASHAGEKWCKLTMRKVSERW